MQPNKKFLFSVFLYFICVAFVSGQHDANLLADCNKIFKDYNEINVFIDRPSNGDLKQISKIASLDHGSTHEVIYLNIAEEQFAAFLELGLSFNIDIDYYAPRQLKMLDEIMSKDPNGCLTTTWDFYPTYEAYAAMMQQFATDYPDICKLENLGVLSSGREILALKISDNVTVSENEPKFLYSSTMHGDETAGYPLLLRLSDYQFRNIGIRVIIT